MIISEWVDSENEKDEILNLSRKIFGNVEIINPSYFDWQYIDNPQGKAIIVEIGIVMDSINYLEEPKFVRALKKYGICL